ncbi:MAG: arsenate reductase (azurin) small subunit [Hyphomicrobiaceae bacterium]|nr:arsenate reductase (azurin) small subunit [Hyphomicrobiaceae bacterium]
MTGRDDDEGHGQQRRPSGVDRRTVLQWGGIAGLASTAALPATSFAQRPMPEMAGKGYPVIEVAPLAEIAVGSEIAFHYPDDDSPALLLRLDRPAEGGIGPGESIVAYSVLCTHKGCPVTFKKSHNMLLCGCHWSSFDPAKAGRMVIGQASEPLPQIALDVSGGVVRAVGVAGLIYGRHTNIR